MLGDQTYDGHVSVHDAAMAADLGLQGAPIEGPTHFSQFDPLGFELFGDEWFRQGCISAHFENMVIEGEQVRAHAHRTSDLSADAWAEKPDGSRVLTATLTIGGATRLLDERLDRATTADPGDLYIVDRLEVGMSTGPDDATLDSTSSNGDLYPFSLADKLAAITEPCEWYHSPESPFFAAVVPTEMLSVMAHRNGNHLPVRGPSVGLFIDLEVRRFAPVLVAESYTVDHVVIARGQSRKVESFWTRSTVRNVAGEPVAEVLLHQGVFKASFADYPM